MIARGDLAVEVGFERLAEVQEEILWLCEASHVPAIWATQVLDTLARTGVPSRAEVTDAAASVAAECVMLNKGPFVDEAVRALADILRQDGAASLQEAQPVPEAERLDLPARALTRGSSAPERRAQGFAAGFGAGERASAGIFASATRSAGTSPVSAFSQVTIEAVSASEISLPSSYRPISLMASSSVATEPSWK